MNKKKIYEEAMEVFEDITLGKVRAFKEGDNAWFATVDVCKILEIGNPSQAITRLDDDEKMTLTTNEGHSGKRGGAQSMTAINTSGLYTLILTSRKPQAKAFKRWVTHVVLPSILEGKNSAGATAYVLGQEDEDDEETQKVLEHGKKVKKENPVMVSINGIMMSKEEALDWDFD